MSLLPQSKYGICSICGGKEQAVIKVKKDLFCISCRNNQKAVEQMDRAKKRNASRNIQAKLRSLPLTDEGREAGKQNDKLDAWFKLVRNKLTGMCQCGCGKPSSKYNDRYFKHSCAHVFPKSKFISIATHPRNFVERAFFGGCHSVMDDTSMDRWTGFADWENIKEIFHELAPLLTDEEKGDKILFSF